MSRSRNRPDTFTIHCCRQSLVAMVSAMLLSLMLPDSSVATEPPTVRRPGVQDLLFITQSRVMVIRLNIDS